MMNFSNGAETTKVSRPEGLSDEVWHAHCAQAEYIRAVGVPIGEVAISQNAIIRGVPYGGQEDGGQANINNHSRISAFWLEGII